MTALHPAGSLYVAARAPRPGEVKTRLARRIGAEPAARLYAAFLHDLGRRFADGPLPLRWYVTPAGSWPEIAALLQECGRVMVREQPEGSWADRQRHLFREAAHAGEAAVVLIASDSPHLEVAVVDHAFELLRGHELVLGPTSDGGYYLLGMRGWHDVLAGATMSHAEVLAQVLDRADALGLRTAVLPTTFDVDEAEDLPLLEELAMVRPDLAATREVLCELGLGDEVVGP